MARSIGRSDRFAWAAAPRLLLIFLTGLMLAAISPAAAQIIPGLEAAEAEGAPAEPAAPLEGVDLEALVQTLENEAERTAFVGRLKDLVAARQALAEEEPDATALTILSDQVKKASEIVLESAALVGEVPELVTAGIEAVQDPELRDRWVRVIVKSVLVLVAAFVVEWAVRAILGGARRGMASRRTDSWVLRAAFLVLLTIIDLVPIAAFAATAYAVLPLTEPAEGTRLVVIALINANVLARLILLAVRALIHPAAPNLRIMNLDDEVSARLYGWSRRVTNVGVYGYFGLQAALLLGLPRELYLLLLQLLGLAIVVILVIAVLKFRAPVAVWIRGTKSTAPTTFEAWALLRRRLAEIWHLLAIVYIIAVYVVWTLGVSGSLAFMVRGTILSIAIIIVASLLSVAASHFIDRAHTGKDDADEGAGAAQPLPRYLKWVHRAADLFIYAVAVLAFLQVWGADVGEWLASGVGRTILGKAVTLAIVFAAAFLLFEFFSRWVERYLSATDESGTVIERGARAKTLLPLARKAMLVVVIVMVIFTTLAEIGIDLAPLIAGAGVIGIAIGFGAQSLVRDIITGFFILLEDTFAVGDVVDLGGNAGLVEAISVRTVKLRDLSGTVHTVPFGDVTRIQNLTKDFSFYLMDVGVAYRENVDEVIQVLRDLSDEMRQDDAYKEAILEPIEILGVDKFADSAVIIKARIKTRPIRQWMVGREFNRRMKHRFDALGIEIPFPHQTLYFGVGKDGKAPPANVRLGASDETEAFASDQRSPEVIEHAASEPPRSSAPAPESERDVER